jgi:hypothetical protein
MVVDRFSMYEHFIPQGHPYIATSVARTFFENIVRLHGLPSNTVSDHNPMFMNKFWSELFELASIKLQLGSVFHPQTDGQSEAINKVIAMYLRCLAGDQP